MARSAARAARSPGACGCSRSAGDAPSAAAPTFASQRDEIEADRAAERVMAGWSPTLNPSAEPHAVRRKCAACSQRHDEDEPLYTKRDARIEGETNAGASSAAASLNAGGAPLPPSVRAFFEPRFEHDFSQVRVHDHARAAAAAERIHAHAFTLGQDIGFARGQYSPHTRRGALLLAHELAHVVQRRGGTGPLARQAAPFRRRTFSDRSGGGSTDFEETVQNAPTRSGDTFSGSVERAEYAPAVGKTPRQRIHEQRVGVQFDTRTCILSVPHKFAFVQRPSANPPICQSPPNATAVTALSSSEVQSIGERYVRAVNAGLNGVFSARLSGCQAPCADRDIQIRADAVIDTSAPDTTIAVVNRAGRGNARTICARQGGLTQFAVHEAGHQVLGVGDEYRESDAGLRQRVPQWARDERVRTDLTRMGGQYDHGRFAMFQERHYRFAQVFLEAAFPDCSVSLSPVGRGVPDYRFEGTVGGASVNGNGALAAGLELSVGLPLTRQRWLELRLGARGISLLALAPQNRTALLLGASAGLEARTSPGRTAATFGLFGSGGVSLDLGGSGVSPTPARTSPYLEGGATLGLAIPIGGGRAFNLQLETALGAEIVSDPTALSWYRLGLRFGATF